MFIGDRRTRRPIRAFRSPTDAVVIPRNAILTDVRTSTEPGHRFPIAMRIAARKNQAMFIFEYAGETLYTPFTDPLMELTTEIEPVYGLS